MTPEDIEQGIRDLGLADDRIRLSLSRLTDLAPAQPAQVYKTVTAPHTATEPSGVPNAELESGS